MQNYHLTALDGGTRVVTEPLPSVRSAAIGLWIGAGSRDEDQAHAGVSHFLEHLIFKGTASYSALEIAEVFDGIGGELNAATARDYTVVYARVLDDHLETALDVMTDMVFAPTLADLETEREVVLEEIAMVEDSPQELIFDLVTNAVFGDHPLGRPVLGDARVVSSVSRRSLGAFHRRRYRPDNVVVAATGSVDHDAFVALVERLAGKAAGGGSSRPAARRPFVAPPPPSLVFQEKPTEQYHLCLGAPGIARSDRRRFTASILDGVLGGSASSRLFQEIREKRGLAYAVYTFSSQYADTGQIGVYLGTREENLGRCLRIVAEQVGEIAEHGPRPDELERAKENLKGRIMLAMELTSNRMSRLGKSLITDSELLDLDRILAEIEAVDAGSVAALAEVLLPPENLSVAAIGPSEGKVLAALEPVCPDLVERAAA
ncbi:MAG TPA: pitrilysin family protein [Gaiellaceae bacterium]|nr:pitrilysin family protein [Gaiellaceae bacterium]